MRRDLLVALSAHLLVAVSSFQTSRLVSSASRSHSCPYDDSTRLTTTLAASAVSGEEQRALALSEYLAKAHEEKLRAIQDVEKKKAAEIEALQREIDELKAQKSPSATTGGAIAMASSNAYAGADDLMSLPKDALVNKVIQYHRFMERYIVEAQEQKFRAVKAAEETLRAKLESQLALGPASAPAPASASLITPVGETALYQARTAAVAKAAAAGKSRWGDMEVQRASSMNVGAAMLPPPVAPSSSPVISVPPEVEAADHGIKAEGSLSLAERVAMGVNAGAVAVAQAMSATRSAVSTVTPPSSGASSLYDKRNARVLASAAAGMSRWGSMEVERVRSLAASLPASRPSTTASTAIPVSVPPEVVAADHGLRSDGSVGGPSLAERVARGAAAGATGGGGGGGGAAVPVQPSRPSAILTLYDRRNIRVLESAAAGRSRWGSREVDRVRDIASHLLSLGGSSASAPTPAAGGGGGGGGRVNLGDQILQKK
jgi:hypothetical protein